MSFTAALPKLLIWGRQVKPGELCWVTVLCLASLIYSALQLSSLVSSVGLKTAPGLLRQGFWESPVQPRLGSTPHSVDLSLFLSCPVLAKEDFSVHLWKYWLQSPPCYCQLRVLELHLQFIAGILSSTVVSLFPHIPAMHLICCHSAMLALPPTHKADFKKSCTVLLHVLLCTSSRKEIAEHDVAYSDHAVLGMLMRFTIIRNTAFPWKIINRSTSALLCQMQCQMMQKFSFTC